MQNSKLDGYGGGGCERVEKRDFRNQISMSPCPQHNFHNTSPTYKFHLLLGKFLICFEKETFHSYRFAFSRDDDDDDYDFSGKNTQETQKTFSSLTFLCLILVACKCDVYSGV